MMEKGRVCMKVAGREAGKICVVLKKIDESFVEITGPRILTGVKRRKCNVAHLEPLPYLLEIEENFSDSQLVEAYEKANLLKKFRLRKPPAHQLKEKKT